MGSKQDDPVPFITLLEDEPLWGDEDDTLGIDPFAEVIAKSVIGTKGPFTIGVYGGWGVGKTTLLRQAKKKAEGWAKQSVFVWFNAWQYEREEHPLMPLLASILRAIEEKALKEPVWAEGFSKQRQTFRNVLLSLFGGLKLKAGYEIPFSKVHGLKGEIAFDSDDSKKRYDELKSEYESAVVAGMYYDAFNALTTATSNENWPDESDYGRVRIVLFIDDLDRCHPDKALLLLDAIKLILSQRNFIFVLGLEPTVLQDYLVSRYKDEFKVGSEGDFGKRYLDKIIQLPFWVPRHGTRFADYADKLIAKVQDDDIRPAFELAKDALIMASDENPRSLVRHLNHLILSASLWRAMGKEPALDEGSVVPAMVVAAVLHSTLDARDFRRLSRSKESCDELLNRFDGSYRPDLTKSAEQQRDTKSDTFFDKVWSVVEGHEGLETLLASEAGRIWLSNHTLRRDIEELLTPQAKEEAPEGQRQIVEWAIRDALKKGDSEPLTKEDYQMVKSLDLGFSALNDEGIELLSTCSNLHELYCYNTQISSLDPLKGLSSLQILNCSGTQISSLDPLNGLTSLQKLFCSGTQISSLDPLNGLTSLQELYCYGTQISSIDSLKGLTSLQILNCSGTQLSSLDPLKGLTSLQELYCHNTQILTLDPLIGLTSLQILNCSGTQLSSLDPLNGLTSLQILNCLDTQLSSLDPLNGLTSLEILYCSGTQISTLDPLKGLTRLQTLDCSGTQISSLDPLKGVTSLYELKCLNTQISSLDPLNGLTSLQILNCFGTQISSLDPLKGLTSLRQLYCSGTQISTLDPLKGLASLQALDCSGTQISSLDPLQGLINLQILNCFGTQISSLDPLNGLKSLSLLLLSKSNALEQSAKQLLKHLRKLKISWQD